MYKSKISPKTANKLQELMDTFYFHWLSQCFVLIVLHEYDDRRYMINIWGCCFGVRQCPISRKGWRNLDMNTAELCVEGSHLNTNVHSISGDSFNEFRSPFLVISNLYWASFCDCPQNYVLELKFSHEEFANQVETK